MFSPRASKQSAMRSGMVRTVGPGSNRYSPPPGAWVTRTPALPPGTGSRSSSVTRRAAPASRLAAEGPPGPAAARAAAPPADDVVGGPHDGAGTSRQEPGEPGGAIGRPHQQPRAVAAPTRP